MTGPKRPLAGAALIGRRIGIAAFWSLALFVTGMSTRSVLIDLYGGKPDGAGDNARCTSELRSLHASLLDQASADVRVRTNASAHQNSQRWLRAWDQRFATTRDACAGMWEARQTLQTLRKKLEVMLREYARDQVPLTERIERALSRYEPTSSRES